MTLLRRLGYASVAIAFLHIVFGAIVRITGSGMGCGDHWPTCYGYWIPPFSRPDLVIEVSHRYLALLLLLVVAAVAVVAWRRRAEPGIGGRGGVLRAAGLALLLWIAPALLGALTVFLGNPPAATVAHKALAAALLAVLAVATIRAGGFGATRFAGSRSTAKARRGALIAAAMAIAAVLLGALTAKLPGAAVACAGFPLCSETSGAPGLAHVQLTHRIVAYLLAFHLLGLAIAFSRRREPRPLVLASRAAVALVLVQVALAAHMVLGGFPAAVRSAHQATGIAIWLTTFVMAYLAGREWDRAVERVAPEERALGPEKRALGPRPSALGDEPGPAVVTPLSAPRMSGAETPSAETVEVVAVEMPTVELDELEDDENEASELDLEIAADVARRTEAREREREEQEEWERAMAHEMAKLDAAENESAADEELRAATEVEERADGQPLPAEGPPPRKPRRLSMAVIIARGADF